MPNLTNTPENKPADKPERFKRNTDGNHKDVYWDETDDPDTSMTAVRESYLTPSGDPATREHRVKTSEHDDFQKDLTRRRQQA